MRRFIVVCMLLFLLPFNIWGQRTSKASSSTTDSLFNDAARQYYVKKLHGKDVRELKATFNGNVTIEFGKRKHQVYNVTVIYSVYKTGMENLHVTDRTVMNYIKELMKSGLITKAKKGFYEKVKFETGLATET